MTNIGQNDIKCIFYAQIQNTTIEANLSQFTVLFQRNIFNSKMDLSCSDKKILCDVKYHQKRYQITEIDEYGNQEIFNNFELNVYKTMDFDNKRPIVKKQENCEYNKVKIKNIINAQIGKKYLNLQHPMRQREVINKYIIENDIEFKPPQNYQLMFYYIDYDEINKKSNNEYKYIFDSDYLKDDVNQKEMINGEDTIKDQHELCDQMLQQIQEFQGGSQSICFLLSFRQSSGKMSVIEQFFTENLEGIIINKKYGIKSQESKNDETIKYIENVEQLKNVYFLDLQILIYYYLTINQKIMLDSNDIQSYLKLYQNKIESDSTTNIKNIIRDQLMQFESIILNNRFLERRLNMIIQLNVPLSYALYETPVTCIQQYIMRQYFNNDYMFLFDNTQEQSISDKYQGGLIEHIQDQYQYTILRNEIQGDYFSLYPTVIVAKNISPETLIYNPINADQCHNIDMNYQSIYQSSQNQFNSNYVIKPNLSYFDKNNTGIIPSIVMKFLNKRKTTTDEIEKATLKIILSSIYGILGQKISPFYDYNCASSVCAFARFACDVARQCILDTKECYCKQITVRNTDSVSYLLKTDNFGQVKKPQSAYKKLLESGWETLNKLIKKKLDSDLFDFKLESDKFAPFVVYSHQKKSYIKIICNLQFYINAKSIELNPQKIFTSLLNQYDPEIKTKNSQRQQSGNTETQLSIKQDKQNFKLEIKGPFSWTSYSSYRYNYNFAQFIKIMQWMVTQQLTENASSEELLQHKNQISNSNQDNCQSQLCQQIAPQNTLHTKQLREINRIILECESNIFERISQNIVDQEFYELKKYATFLKYSDDDKKCKFLKNTYNIDKGIQIIQYLDELTINQKLKSNCIIPLNRIDKHNINRVLSNQIIKEFLAPIKLFFDIKCQGQEHKLNAISYQLDKSICLDNDECFIRIEQTSSFNQPNDAKVDSVVKAQISRKFKVVKFIDIEYLIQKSPNVSVHEIISRKHNKMFFDIDSTIEINYDQLYKCISNGVAKISDYFAQLPKIHIAKAHKYDKEFTDRIIKWSYHVVIDIQCHIATNEYIAKQMNSMIKKTLKVDDKQCNIFDLGIYRQSEDSSSSLRLPNCVKFDKNNEIENRKFQIVSKDSKFIDFIINRVQQCQLVFPKCILFDQKPPLNIQSINMRFTPEDITQIVQHLKDVLKVDYKTCIIEKRNIILLKCFKKINCIVCQRMHDNEHLYVMKTKCDKYAIHCYQNKKNNVDYKPPYIISLDQEETKIQEKDLLHNFKQINKQVVPEDFSDIATTIVQSRYVEFQLSNNINYIISDLGTGKSQHLKQYLESTVSNNNKTTILCLSFRRTFSIEFAKKYNLQNYMDIKGQLSSNITPRLIIQVDSLIRYDTTTYPNYLIIDEIESLLEKIPSCSQETEVMQKFINLLKNCEKVIIMDGLMEKKTIEYLNLFRGTDNFNVVYNTITPRQDYKMSIYKYTNNDLSFVANMILEFVKNNKNVYGMVASKSQGLQLKEFLQTNHIKCIFYTGDDANIEVTSTENGTCVKSQLDIKNEHFQNVNHYWQQYQVVIHNSAITAGVSFDLDDYFDYQVNIFNAGTCSSLSFVQGMHRVRHIKSKQIFTFVEEEFVDKQYTPQAFTDLQFDLDLQFDVTTSIDISLEKQFETWLSARDGCAKKFRTQLLFKYIKKMNYNISICDYPNDYKKQSYKADKTVYQQMQSAQLTENDLQLSDKDYLSSYFTDNKDVDSFEHLKLVQAKLLKIDILYKYAFNITQINSLSSLQFEQLHKQMHIQKTRLFILKTYQIKYHEIQSHDWFLEKYSLYGIKRGQYYSYTNDELQVIAFTQFAIQIKQSLQNQEQTCDLLEIKNQLFSDPRVLPFKKIIKINKKTKPITLLSNMFTLFFNQITLEKINGSNDPKFAFSLLNIKNEYLLDQDSNQSDDSEN